MGGIFMALAFLFLVFLVVANTILCYLVWKRSRAARADRMCHCGKKEVLKVQ
jgi:hypothetical protein